ncbi:hypothetical protein PHYSODRAFT_525185 [Plasmopara halstedii]|uniref:Aquaporin n=1 Tax=Plasmopara halstedii TaxID=4781 RepID=A0A0P1B5P3_PLAHL|nr:hypothetical protein PHYSODRAFT_525185 [Plasmopara halstedii]CEG49701.1 hypothetical protein PHYSODRAFT_525185 [Plasmopara halstedii]|eukprot:XP_024586070.1 hypothetical protein PHYSODRAFT_525185 [Plasmopara halstedii]
MKGNYFNIILCWGLGVFFGIHIAVGVSGAHLNPAVTTTLAWCGRMEWKKVPFYIILQILGAFAAAFVVWGVYLSMFNMEDVNRRCICKNPYSDDVPVLTRFLTEVVGSALLISCIFAIGDQLDKPASPYSQLTALALVVVAIGMAFRMILALLSIPCAILTFVCLSIVRDGDRKLSSFATPTFEFLSSVHFLVDP